MVRAAARLAQRDDVRNWPMTSILGLIGAAAIEGQADDVAMPAHETWCKIAGRPKFTDLSAWRSAAS